MRLISAILLAVALNGCASNAVVYLQNAAGEMVRCAPYPDSASATPADARRQVDNCVSDYQQRGYKTVPSPLRMIPYF
jgi:hypothetical protein